MSDPAVSAYLTKLLCSYGGRLDKNRLADLLDLPGQQIEQILQDEPLKFPQSSEMVLARSPLRICTIYLHPKEEEETCTKLHLCRNYLRGQCPPTRQPQCRFSHDVLSDHNRSVLKANKLTGLNEDEIKVLLFQNDNQLLPDNCRKYMHNNCDQGEDCTRLHVCSYFIQGECKNCFCKRSHNLLEGKILLNCSWLSQEAIQNFQMLCVLTNNERQQALKEEPKNEEPRSARGMSQGRGREPGNRARSHDLLKDRSRMRNKGLHISQQSDSGLPSHCTEIQRLGDEKYNRVGDYDSEKRLHHLMDDWFSQNTAPLGNVQIKSSETSAGGTPQEGTKSSISSLTLNKLVTSSMETSFNAEPGIIPSIISAKPSSVSIKSKTSSIKTPSTPNQTPVKELGEKVCSPVAEPANVKSISSSVSKSSLCSTSECPCIAKTKPATSVIVGNLESSSSLPNSSNFSGASMRADTPSRKHQTNVKTIAKLEIASGIQKPKLTKTQPTTNIYSVIPQKSDKKLDELGTCTNNSQPNTKKVSSSILSSEPPIIYFFNPTASILFTAENKTGILNYQKMNQMKDHYLTESQVCWRPESLDFDRVKTLRARIKPNADNSKQKPVYSTSEVVYYSPTWDMNAVPEVGYQNIPVPQTCNEFSNIAKMFSKTVLEHEVLKMWRVQNPTLWRVYQWQKDQMKKKNSGNVDERQLFHGTDCVNVNTICRGNFDWSVCGSNNILYGQGNYFAKDAAYAHGYSPANRTGTRTMFVARVLVGDFIKGDPTMRRPPQKYKSAESYNSCVNNVTSPSIFVVFEKSQVYPEYILEYKKKESVSLITI
ncbi:protein mono-ADP-ribosyltransferase PARP12-like [Mantella aurantiaca]